MQRENPVFLVFSLCKQNNKMLYSMSFAQKECVCGGGWGNPIAARDMHIGLILAKGWVDRKRNQTEEAKRKPKKE